MTGDAQDERENTEINIDKVSWSEDDIYSTGTP